MMMSTMITAATGVPDAPILEIHWPVLPSACLNLSRDALGAPQERTGRAWLCALELVAWRRIFSERPGAMGHSLRTRHAAPTDQRALADDLDAADLSPMRSIRGVGVRVKVERLRGGRRLPDVEYIETRAPRRPRTDKQESVSFRAHSAQVDRTAARLRLPWRINRRSD